MPLNGQSPAILHVLQNIFLIITSLYFAPLCTLMAISSRIIAPYTAVTKHIRHHRQWRATSSSTFRPRTVLVTGVGMSKGLAIARSFYRAGHRVIGADFEPYRIPVAGRFSVALEKFFRVSKPSPSAGGSQKYIDDLIKIIKEQQVEVWVSCSGVASAIEDGEAAEAVERLTKCKAVQFNVALTETLHEKHSFIENTKKLGLNVPDTHLVTSVQDAMELLHPEIDYEMDKSTFSHVHKKYIMKSVGLDDSIRADMTLLPRPSISETKIHISRLEPSPSRPFVLQQFIAGPEYCTHSIVIRGQVLAFTACRSAELLMHYRALPPTSMLSRVMLKYTQNYAKGMGESMTGHFSIDFLLDEEPNEGEADLMDMIYPIECNPRAHTAVVLFADESVAMAEAYLTILDDPSPPPPSTTSHNNLGYVIVNKSSTNSDVIIPSSPVGYYWIGHDIVTRLILPIFNVLVLKITINDLLTSWMEFAEHLLYWRDGTYEIWDPWPAWWLYCGYWPAMFAARVITRTWWSRCNVSTTKVFGC